MEQLKLHKVIFLKQIERLNDENEHLKEKCQYLEQKLVEMNQKSRSY